MTKQNLERQIREVESQKEIAPAQTSTTHATVTPTGRARSGGRVILGALFASVESLPGARRYRRSIGTAPRSINCESAGLVHGFLRRLGLHPCFVGTCPDRSTAAANVARMKNETILEDSRTTDGEIGLWFVN